MQRKRETPYHGLTVRELAVVQAVCAGAETRQALAEVLVVGTQSVDKHLYMIRRRLGVVTLAGIILFVLQDEALRQVCFPQITGWSDA